MTHMIEETKPDFEALKQRQQQTWSSGDFHVVAAKIVLTAEHLVDTADLHAGRRVRGQRALALEELHGSTIERARRRVSPRPRPSACG